MIYIDAKHIMTVFDKKTEISSDKDDRFANAWQ